LTGDEEVLAAERVGMEILRPAVAHQAVADNRLDLLAVAGNALHNTVGFETPAGRVEEHQFSHAARVVVTADHGHKLRRMIGNGPGVEHRVGPVGIAAVVFHLPRTVRVHVEKDARDEMGNVGVFPAQIKNPSVVEDGRAPGVVLVERKTAHCARVPVVVKQIGDLRGAVTQNARERRR
jgi:hypothetical protein